MKGQFHVCKEWSPVHDFTIKKSICMIIFGPQFSSFPQNIIQPCLVKSATVGRSKAVPPTRAALPLTRAITQPGTPFSQFDQHGGT